METLQHSIYHFVDPFEVLMAGPRKFEPIRIAILDSGFDPEHPLALSEGRLDPRIKAARSFVHGTGQGEFRDEIGHGTHALGLLLKVATCAEIYIAKIAHRESLSPNSYDDIAKAS
jgi:subtilisin family serine protease